MPCHVMPCHNKVPNSKLSLMIKWYYSTLTYKIYKLNCNEIEFFSIWWKERGDEAYTLSRHPSQLASPLLTGGTCFLQLPYNVAVSSCHAPFVLNMEQSVCILPTTGTGKWRSCIKLSPLGDKELMPLSNLSTEGGFLVRHWSAHAGASRSTCCKSHIWSCIALFVHIQFCSGE